MVGVKVYHAGLYFLRGQASQTERARALLTEEEMSATPLLVKPTIEEVKLQAAKIGLPESQAERFFYYYQSNGWRVGKNPMRCWLSAMAGWKVRWQNGETEREHQISNADKVILGREYERILSELKQLESRYSEGMLDWKQKDRERRFALIQRRNELRIKLGIKM